MDGWMIFNNNLSLELCCCLAEAQATTTLLVCLRLFCWLRPSRPHTSLMSLQLEMSKQDDRDGEDGAKTAGVSCERACRSPAATVFSLRAATRCFILAPSDSPL